MRSKQPLLISYILVAPSKMHLKSRLVTTFDKQSHKGEFSSIKEFNSDVRTINWTTTETLSNVFLDLFRTELAIRPSLKTSVFLCFHVRLAYDANMYDSRSRNVTPFFHGQFGSAYSGQLSPKKRKVSLLFAASA